jgi:hypothetical protein
MTSRSIYRSTVLGLILAFVGGFFSDVHGQKKPFLLNPNTTLSPLSKNYYKDVADRYKNNPTKEDRDRLIFMAVSQIDINFRAYQRNRRVGNNLFQTLVDILEVGAVAAVSITNGVRAKSVINDGLAFVKGSRASVNKNLRLLELQIIFNKMRENRAKVLNRMLENVKENDANYPFERAYLDIVDYYIAGTMDDALASVATDTGTTAKEAEKKLDETKKTP